MVVGAPFHSSQAGQAYVYVRSGTTWSEQAKLVASDGAAGDVFGALVAISGDILVVGAQLHNTDGKPDAGQAYVYVRSGTTWTEQAKLKASDAVAQDEFGWAAGVSGDTVVVGAPFHAPCGPIPTTCAGQAYVYDLAVVAPDITVSPLSLVFVSVGSVSSVQTVTVRNDGTASLTLGTITLGGANPNQFKKPALQDLCSGNTLSPTQTCTVKVKFKPTHSGAQSATLVIPSNDFNESSVPVTLGGTGL